jgi:glycosyltransferase involved in cell wall biosynthesis
MSANRPHISIVTPVYGRTLDLKGLYDRLVASLAKISPAFEIIMVNDHSPDDSWDVIKKLSASDPRVRGVNLSRNFGQHQAITAGLHYARGDWTVVMDCDLQDRPEEIPTFYAKAKEGYDVVMGRRYNRQDNFLKKQASKLFYRIFNYLTDQKLDNRIANFGIYSAKVIDSVKKYKEKDRSFGLLVSLVGFKRTGIDIVHDNRTTGQSSYSFKKALELAIGHILSHTNKPLRLFVKVGFIISTLSFFLSPG